MYLGSFIILLLILNSIPPQVLLEDNMYSVILVQSCDCKIASTEILHMPPLLWKAEGKSQNSHREFLIITWHIDTVAVAFVNSILLLTIISSQKHYQYTFHNVYFHWTNEVNTCSCTHNETFMAVALNYVHFRSLQQTNTFQILTNVSL